MRWVLLFGVAALVGLWLRLAVITVAVKQNGTGRHDSYMLFSQSMQCVYRHEKLDR